MFAATDRRLRTFSLLDAATLAFASWTLIYWVSLVVAVPVRAAAILWGITLPACVILGSRRESTPEEHAALNSTRWVRLAVAGIALGSAALSLFIVRPDDDDVYYVNRSTFIAEHGIFPNGDTLMSDQAYPALEKPPVSAFEPLVGTVANVTGLQAGSVVYYLVPPLATLLSVLAMFRLLRTWDIPFPLLALAVAVLFLLMDATANATWGNLWIGRMFQGKVIFVSVAVPLLFAALAAWLRAPTRRRLLMLLALGIAVTGLGPTATIVVPLVTAAALLPALLRRQWSLIAGGAVVLAAPIGAGIVGHLAGGLSASIAQPSDLDPLMTLLRVAGTGVLAGITIAALFGGWIAPARLWMRVAIAGASAIAALVLAPHVLPKLNDLTGAGTVLWRLLWVVPVAALVGALATVLFQVRRFPRLLAAALPVALGALMVVTGTPIWSSANGASLASRPAWKRPPQALSAARAIVAMSSPGSVVLAPPDESAAIAILTTRIRAVDPRSFLLNDYAAFPGFDVTDREVLDSFEQSATSVARAAVVTALQALDVRLACVDTGDAAGVAMLQGLGYAVAGTAGEDTCLRPA